MLKKVMWSVAGLAVFSLLAVPLGAQQAAPAPATAARTAPAATNSAASAAPAPQLTAEEREAILRPALDYAEGWYEGDAAKMERALHPELVKRIVQTDPNTKRSVLNGMGASVLVNNVARGFGKETPKDKQLADAKILDVFGNAASVKVEMAGWVDYLHIAKFNGRWVIVNVLWELKPRAN